MLPRVGVFALLPGADDDYCYLPVNSDSFTSGVDACRNDFDSDVAKPMTSAAYTDMITDLLIA